MSGIRAALGRLMRRVAIVAFAVLLAGAVGVVAKARADAPGEGTSPSRYETVRDAPRSGPSSPAAGSTLRIVP